MSSIKQNIDENNVGGLTFEIFGNSSKNYGSMKSMEKRRKREDFFEKYAAIYEKKRSIEGGKLFNEFIEVPATESLIEKVHDKINVLDIGCGGGYYTIYFSAKGAHVTAIDSSQKMLDFAIEKCKNLDDIKFIKTSLEDFQTEEKFDVIIGGFMLSYFDDLNETFNQLESMLNPAGYIILSMLHPVRLSAVKREFFAYSIENYFNEDKYFETDLDIEDNIPKEEKLRLIKWNLEDIFKAAKNNKLYIDELLEPVPLSILPNTMLEKAKFYYKNPSIVVFKFKKRK